MKQHSIRKLVSELFEEGTSDVMVKNMRMSSAEQQILVQRPAKFASIRRCEVVQTSMQEANLDNFATAASGSNNLC